MPGYQVHTRPMGSLRASDRAGLDAATMLCNISIIPPANVGAAVVGLSRRLADNGALFEIDNADRHAHLTLYMARFPRATVEELLLRVKMALADLAPIRLEHDGYFCTPGSYYEVSYRRASQLLTAHGTITRAVRSLRSREPVVEDYYGPYSAEQQANVRRHGYDLAGALYRPHITITRFPARLSGELPVAAGDLSFTATTIGVFQADQLGAARQLLHTFAL